MIQTSHSIEARRPSFDSIELTEVLQIGGECIKASPVRHAIDDGHAVKIALNDLGALFLELRILAFGYSFRNVELETDVSNVVSAARFEIDQEIHTIAGNCQVVIVPECSEAL
jgi:hypothetical protein